MLPELVRRDLLRPLRAPVPVGCLCVCRDAEPAMDESRLKQIRPFAGLSTAERKMRARVVDKFRAPAGTTLVSQGDYGYEFMVIEEGTVDVIRDGERIATMGPGDFFGELAVLAVGGQRNASVVASSPVRVVTLTAHDMRSVREHMPQIDRVIADRTPPTGGSG
jgi:CRP/FNR family cyclic AMP-dependent transcriptional regulator